jgi:hypothetical protein
MYAVNGEALGHGHLRLDVFRWVHTVMLALILILAPPSEDDREETVFIEFQIILLVIVG